MPQVLVIVDGTRPITPGTFPGSKTLLQFCSHVGLPLADLIFAFCSDHTFDTTVANCPAPVALCLGPKAFEHFTGIKIAINDSRGFLFQPSDCIKVKQKLYQQIGTYKTTKKGKYQKGDPRFAYRPFYTARTLNPALLWIIPTLDPYSVQSDIRDTTPALKADLLRVKRFAAGSVPFSAPTMLLSPGTGGFVTLDIETASLTGPVTRIGLATNDGVWSAPWNFETRALTQACIDQAQIIQGHNLAFDIPMLEAEGVYFHGKVRFDTMLAARFLSPDMPMRLEYVASLYLDIPTWKYLSAFDMHTYNALDAWYTHLIAQHQYADLARRGSLDLFTNTVMPATEILIDMTKRGIKVDIERLWSWRSKLNLSLRLCLDEWNSLAPGIDYTSYHQLSKYFYKTLGFKPHYAKRRTKKGKVQSLSTDEEAVRSLRSLYPQHAPMLTALLNTREVAKQLSTYASLELSLDDCVHPRYLPATKNSDDGTTSTGRIASTDPNIQNQTPESKLLFIPHWPNWLLLEFDFSQIELRIAACLSDDLQLQHDLKGDVHAAVMDRLRVDRTRAKNLVYGSIYGAGPGKLAKTLRAAGVETTYTECARLQEALSRTYPQLWAWRDSVSALGCANRFLVNPFGRKLYFRRGDSQVPEMLAFLPQSTAADILLSLLPPLHSFATAFGGFFLTTTHDSGLFEFPAASLTPALSSALRRVCEREWLQLAPGFRVPIKLKVGPSWGTMNPWDGLGIIASGQVGAVPPPQDVPADGQLAGP